MRIAILSDTHDQVARTRAAVSLVKAQGAEAFIHCGDVTGPEVIFECAGLPGFYVFGNNDFNKEALRQAMAGVGGVCLGKSGELTLAGRRIAVTHGDSIQEIRRLEARSPDYLLFGHSHRRTDEREGPTRRINPGALFRATEWTVALLDLETDELEFLHVVSSLI